MSRANPVRWFEIYVADLARAKVFYEGLLGVKLQRLEGAVVDMMTFGTQADIPGARGALVHMPGYEPKAGGTIVYFDSDDCASEEARVVPLGGRVQKPKTPIGPHGFIMLARDTEGNLFGVHSRK